MRESEKSEKERAKRDSHLKERKERKGTVTLTTFLAVIHFHFVR